MSVRKNDRGGKAGRSVVGRGRTGRSNRLGPRHTPDDGGGGGNRITDVVFVTLNITRLLHACAV